MISSSRCVLFAIYTSIVSTAAYAALPQPGLWAIDAEMDGQPGRGIQIDRQGGDLIVVSYFGYRADGSATFLQAAGRIGEDKRTFSADLNEYRNGPTLGGPIQSGELAKVVGPMQMEFDTATSGSIHLPGEARQPISRFTFDDHRIRLNNDFFLTEVHLDGPHFATRQGWATFKQSGDQLEFSTDLLNAQATCTFNGDLTPRGDGFTSSGRYACGDPAASPQEFYRLEGLRVDDLGFLSGTLLTSATQDFSQGKMRRWFGACSYTPEDTVTILGVYGTGDRCKADRLERSSQQVVR